MSITPATEPDTGVAEHYGNPLREQRMLAESCGVVDRSHRGVLRISGADRLTWMHTLTTQHLENLTPGESTQALVLDAKGRVEHHLLLVDDGDAVWVSVEPGTQGALLEYLEKMRFMFDVLPEDVTQQYAVYTVVGPESEKILTQVRDDAARITTPSLSDIPSVDLIMPRQDSAEWPAELREVAHAGVGAYEALRVAAILPRLGIDTDHRSLPHELGWIGSAVHLNKGCYRGQETVAKIHNLGQRPRRAVLLHLDGFSEELPTPGTELLSGEKRVGRIGTAVRHYELGMIAFGVVKRNTENEAELHVSETQSIARVDG